MAFVRTIRFTGKTANRMNHSFDKWVRQVEKHIRIVGKRELRELGTAVQEQVQVKIASGAAEGPALAKSTRQRKGHGTKLVDSGAYAESIITRAISTGHARFRAVTVLVGIDPRVSKGRVHPAVPAVHEFGGSTPQGHLIPARKHWGPAIKEVEQSGRFKRFLSGRWINAGVPYKG